MSRKRFSSLLMIFSIIGSVVGFIAGEYLLLNLNYKVPDFVLVGLYFGVLSLSVGIFILLAEMIKPHLCGWAWRSRYLGSSWKYLILCTLVLLFISSGLLQFLYGLDFNRLRKINDVVLLIDTSGSMSETDPNNERFKAVENLINNMKSDNRAAVFVFSDGVEPIQSMEYVDNSLKGSIMNRLTNYSSPDGQTNIKGALDAAIGHISASQTGGRVAMVIALTDGMDNYGLVDTFENTIEPFEDAGIPIYTIGMNENYDLLLSKIAQRTGGSFYKVDEARNLKNLFNKIYIEKDKRLLVDRRNGAANASLLFTLVRILFVTIIGGVLGFGWGLIFDNKYISKSFGTGGLLSGFIAGLILETGFRTNPENGFLLRLWAVLTLGTIYTFFTLIFGVGAGSNYCGGDGYYTSPDGEENKSTEYRKSTF